MKFRFMDIIKEQAETSIAKYPLYIYEKNKRWVDLLSVASNDKHIWNIDFKNAKFYLSRNFEDIGKSGDAFVKDTAKYAGIQESEVWPSAYGISKGTFQDFQSINKLIRIFERFAETSKIAQKYLELYKSWKTIKDLLDVVKPFIEKGKKIDTSKQPKQIYRPPHQSVKILGEVKILLEDLIQKHKNELRDYYINMISGMANRFMKERTVETASPSKFFKHSFSDIGIIESLFEFDEKRDPWEYKWYKDERTVKIKYRSDADEKIKKFAEIQADTAAEAFVFNNMKKLTAVIGEKTKSGIVLTHKEVDGSFGYSFKGRIKFEFSDKTGFTTRNDIIMNVSPHGLIFNQFPITFHNVTFKNGKFVKFVSEKAMNEVWAKE